MTYRNRKYLAILKLTEDRDYATYDELISLLTEQPSHTVYIERDGILRGIISVGDILRKRDEHSRRVSFNQTFTFVHPGEYWRVRQIFSERKNINILPVISEDGHLLGDYVRWDSSICMDHAKLLCKDPYVLEALKAHIQKTFFVEPAVHGGGADRGKLFLWWRQGLENEGVRLRVIQHWEIKDDYTVKYYVFIDEDERSSAVALNLYLDQKTFHGQYITLTEYFYRMSRFGSIYCADSTHLNESIVKKLQNQGIFVLAFGFQENSNQYLATLWEKIRKRYEKYSVDNSHRFLEAFKESFADELYCEAYKKQSFPLPMFFHRRLGVPYLNDVETEFVHIRNGERLTVNQPEEYDRCIYLYGPCNVLGLYVSDQYTISSLLQGELNQAGFACKVVNRGFPEDYASAERLRSESFKQGDILVIDQFIDLTEDFPILNLTDALEKHDVPVDWFADDLRHCNHKVNKVCAHEIYQELVPVLQQLSGERKPVKLEFDYIERFYLSHYFSDFDHTSYKAVGAIVMNCNPFTFGHRFLIEEALKTVDFLIIFVVEEDESIFSFQERFAMVCQGTSDLEHIMVVPSGPYILSKNTFPEYFLKVSDEDLKQNTEDDITLFAEKIAPKLGISYRFVGEEREDKVTNEYNEAMKRLLPRYGIQVVEIPRKSNKQVAISASRVRHCLSMNHMEELNGLVPASTKRILFYEQK